MRIIARLLSWTMLLAVAFVTLAPIEFRPETGLPPQAERFGAFLLVAISLRIAYPRHRLLGICALVIVAGMLEALQDLVPGRHGRLHDFEAKAVGVLVGAIAGFGLEALVRPVGPLHDGGRSRFGRHAGTRTSGGGDG